ncbi:MAG UNVERIFIED_CONTAM: hypothetical protein LVR29_19125 [Microcystis novacekii LVE1205-3]
MRREAIKASIYLRPNYPQADLVRHLQPLLFDIHLDICQETAILVVSGTAASAKALNPLAAIFLNPR